MARPVARSTIDILGGCRKVAKLRSVRAGTETARTGRRINAFRCIARAHPGQACWQQSQGAGIEAISSSRRSCGQWGPKCRIITRRLTASNVTEVRTFQQFFRGSADSLRLCTFPHLLLPPNDLVPWRSQRNHAPSARAWCSLRSVLGIPVYELEQRCTHDRSNLRPTGRTCLGK